MTQPIKLDAEAFYDDGALTLSLQLRRTAIAKARKTGELKSTHRGGRPLYLGRWVFEWLTGESRPAAVEAVA